MYSHGLETTNVACTTTLSAVKVKGACRPSQVILFCGKMHLDFACQTQASPQPTPVSHPPTESKAYSASEGGGQIGRGIYPPPSWDPVQGHSVTYGKPLVSCLQVRGEFDSSSAQAEKKGGGTCQQNVGMELCKKWQSLRVNK